MEYLQTDALLENDTESRTHLERTPSSQNFCFTTETNTFLLQRSFRQNCWEVCKNFGFISPLLKEKDWRRKLRYSELNQAVNRETKVGWEVFWKAEGEQTTIALFRGRNSANKGDVQQSICHWHSLCLSLFYYVAPSRIDLVKTKKALLRRF